MIAVRDATPADIPHALAAAPRFLNEAPAIYRSMPLSPARLTKSIEKMMSERLFLVAVSAATDHCVGFGGVVLGQPFFSEVMMALELFWWVDPKVRGRAGVRLFDALVNATRAAGARYFVPLALDGPNATELHTFYTRRGCVLFERAYIMEL